MVYYCYYYYYTHGGVIYDGQPYETPLPCLVISLCSSSLLRAGRRLRPMWDRPITPNDESQVCWLISLNCKEEGGGGNCGNCSACKIGWERARAGTLQFPWHGDGKCHSALWEHTVEIYSRSLPPLSASTPSLASASSSLSTLSAPYTQQLNSSLQAPLWCD